jgi:hypothetical protein
VAPGLDVYRNTEFRPSARLAREIDGDRSPSGGHLALLVVELALVGAIVRGALWRAPRHEARTDGTTADPPDGTTADPPDGTTADPPDGTTADPPDGTTAPTERTTAPTEGGEET